jgi:hypothetical protein
LRFLKVCTISVSLLIGACAGDRATTSHPSDYVEIENPTATMAPGAPATIWVPRSSLESGVPRGSEVVKKGAEQVIHGIRGDSAQTQTGVPVQQPPQAAALPANQQSAAAPAYAAQPSANRQTVAIATPQPYDSRMQASALVTSSVKNRIAILETDRGGLTQPLYDNLRRSTIGGVLDPGQAAFLSQSANLTSETEKASFSNRLQLDYGVNVVIFLSAPEGAGPGKEISAEIYDAMEGGLLQKFDATIPQNSGADQNDPNFGALPAPFTEKIREYLALLPWYGRITAVNGNRAYIAAGREAGLRIGQVLKIYQSGRFMKGLGFAPGEQVGSLAVQGFVGPNGSFGVIREGQGIKATDIVSVE